MNPQRFSVVPSMTVSIMSLVGEAATCFWFGVHDKYQHVDFRMSSQPVLLYHVGGGGSLSNGACAAVCAWWGRDENTISTYEISRVQ